MSPLRSPIVNFESISPSEFFYRNRQMAGFGNPAQAVYSAVRELVENSLDSCDDAQKSPIVRIEIRSDESSTVSIVVTDNGAGVPDEQIPDAFGRVLYGSKYTNRQKRGTFGLGVTMAVLYGQITTDRPMTVHSRTEENEGLFFQLLIDVENNSPLVVEKKALHRSEIGTTVTITMKGDLKRSQDRIVDYLRLSTISTPHARFHLKIDDEVELSLGGFSKFIPPPVMTSLPHPRAADVEILRRLIQRNGTSKLYDFLCGSFQKIGPRTATKFLRFMNLNPSRIIGDLEREDLVSLASALRNYDGFESPDGKCLSPIGTENFKHSVSSLFNASKVYYSIRGPSEWQGNPFIIEAVLAVGDEFPRSDIPTLYRFANRVPLLYDLNDDLLMKVLKRTRWARYNLDTAVPVALFVHICSTRIPFKAAGKQSIASISEIEAEAHLLFKELGRKLNKMTTQVQHSAREAKKMREFTKSFRQIVRFSASLAESETVPTTDALVRKLFEVDSNA